jgi:predicted transcriptional regulator
VPRLRSLLVRIWSEVSISPLIRRIRRKKMTEKAQQPKDKNYNLISVLHQSADSVDTVKTYIQDAEQEGDQELVDFFSSVLDNNQETSQRAKEMLVQRLEREQE